MTLHIKLKAIEPQSSKCKGRLRYGVKIRLLTACVLILCFVTFSINIQAETLDYFSETQQKLAGMDQKQTEILQKLFTQVQGIEAMEKEAQGINKEIVAINEEIDNLQKAIQDEERDYDKKRDNLKELLQSYQRMGAGTYLEIILEAKDFTDFLRRINTLREITRNTGELLSQIETSKEKLAAEKEQMNNRLSMMQDKQSQLEVALTEEKELRKRLELDLAALSQEKVQYKDYLRDLEREWDNLKPFFSRTVAQFTQMIEEGNLPTDAFKISLGLSGIRGALGDQKLNEILASYPQLPKMVFSFKQNQVELFIPEHYLRLKGTFELLDEQTLRFKVEEGSFSGMPLQKGAVEDLFQEGDMRIDLKSLLGSFKLRSVELMDGSMELSLGF